jgi:hydrogenase nickel incorporation protein HypB
MTLTTRLERIPPAEVRLAEDTAALLQAMGIVVVHLFGPPGSGKTSLILRTVESLTGKVRPAVVVGALSSQAEPSPLDNLDLPSVQVNTGGQPCLNANMLREALEKLPLADVDLVLVEEIGTLTIPVEHSLGENLRVVVASLPQGEDCPSRYPEPFAHADAIVLNMVDLQPYLGFDRARFQQAVRRLNPQTPIFELSCRTGEGLETWWDWLLEEARGRAS